MIFFTVTDAHLKDERILESVYSYQMCSNRDELQPTNRLMVPYKTVRVRTIQIRMHDGIARTFVDVSELKKNFISLGTLDLSG